MKMGFLPSHNKKYIYFVEEKGSKNPKTILRAN